jgi:hypothetical protein
MVEILEHRFFRFARWCVPGRPALRLAAYVAMVCGVLFVVLTRSALGAVREASLEIGRRLEGLDDVLGATKVVEVNGQRVFVSTGNIAMPLRQVLDHVDRACREHPGALTQMADEAASARALRPSEALSGFGVLRQESGEDGAILCLVRRSGGESFREAIRTFMATRDVGALGDAVLVYAHAVSPATTHVRTTWTRGPLKVLEMFPAAGDAPGSDSSTAARPRRARRLLTGVTPDAPYGVRVYTTRDPPEPVLDAFDTDMAARGWTRLASGFSPSAHGYVHPSGIQALAQAAQRPDGTVFSLVELGVGRSDVPLQGNP